MFRAGICELISARLRGGKLKKVRRVVGQAETLKLGKREEKMEIKTPRVAGNREREMA